MRWVGVALLVLGLASQAGAGEILFANGSRLAGELANEVLMVSTGSDLIEVVPEQVSLLTRDEIHLKDGRVLRGTLVGGRVKVRTALGEIAIKLEELKAFRAEPATRSAAPAATEPAPASAPTAPAPAVGATERGLAGVGPRERGPGRRFEVVAEESALYRDAVQAARPVGKVVRGEQVTYLDYIDRRLQLFDTLLFDGGYWIKVRAADGTEGWLPATALREVQ